jgi:hypothetical protein
VARRGLASARRHTDRTVFIRVVRWLFLKLTHYPLRLSRRDVLSLEFL